MTIHTTVDGTPRTYEARESDSVFDVVFPEAGAFGRCPASACLHCTVLLGERAVLSCRVPAFRADGNQITTIEGFRHTALYGDLVRAFDRIGVGHCLEEEPGIALLAADLFAASTVPRDEEIRAASRHLTTRCIERETFVRVVRMAAGVRRRRRGARGGRG